MTTPQQPRRHIRLAVLCTATFSVALSAASAQSIPGASSPAAAASATASEVAIPPLTASGQVTTLAWQIPTPQKRGGRIRYTLEPVDGVRITSRRSGTISWDGRSPIDLPIKLTVSPTFPAGLVKVARIGVWWPDGSPGSFEVNVHVHHAGPVPGAEKTAPRANNAAAVVSHENTVTAASAQSTTTTAAGDDFEAELIPTPRGAAPGSSVRLMYAIFSYVENDERVRFRLEAAPGWRLTDSEVEQREFAIEAFDILEGDLFLTVPEDARVGDRQLVRLLVEVVGSGSQVIAENYVSVLKRGGVKPGVPSLSGASTIGVTRLGVGDPAGVQRSGGLTLSSKFKPQSNFSLSYDHGVRQNLSNFRYEEEQTRLTGNLRHAGWDLNFGNYVNSMGDALSGPYVRGRGASVRRLTGLLVSDFLAAQPNTIGGDAAGHVVRARLGVRTNRLTLAITGSDFGRPAGGYTTLSTFQTTVVDSDTEERLEFERRLTAAAPSNRVQGVGVDAEFRPSTAHRFSMKAGELWLTNAAGLRLSAPSGEASYYYNTRRANLSARFRETPPTLSGIMLPGDELSADGNVRVISDLRVVGSVYDNSTETVGTSFFSRGNGASAGLRFARGARRIEMRGSYRESQYSTIVNTRRTVSLSGGLPVGPFSVSGNADVGEQESGTRTSRVRFYRGDVRWVKEAGTASVSATHSDTGGVIRRRFDAMTSLKLGDLELAGGAWTTRGYTIGGRPGAWTSIGVPVGFDSIVTFGIDYTPLTWIAAPSLRGSVWIRKNFMMAVPFVHAATPAAPPAQTP